MQASGFISVRTGGGHREMGVDLGRAVREILLELLAESAAFYERSGHGADIARNYALRHFLPAVRKYFPDFLDETRGIAEGAGLSFENVFFLTADEEISDLLKKPEKCSSAAVRTGDGFYLMHNEDYPPRYFGRLVIVQAEPDDAPAFMSLTYPYIIAGPSCGLNASGLAFAVDSLSFPPRRAGLPSNFVLRSLYSARKLADIKPALNKPNVLMGNAATVVSADEQRAITVEAGPTGTIVIRMDASGLLAHTNHAISSSLDRRGEKPTISSRERLAALKDELSEPRTLDPARLKKIISSSKNGLCRPVSGPGDSCTIASAVLDPERRVMYVADRGPQGHGFRRYRLGRL